MLMLFTGFVFSSDFIKMFPLLKKVRSLHLRIAVPCLVNKIAEQDSSVAECKYNFKHLQVEH